MRRRTLPAWGFGALAGARLGAPIASVLHLDVVVGTVAGVAVGAIAIGGLLATVAALVTPPFGADLPPRVALRRLKAERESTATKIVGATALDGRLILTRDRLRFLSERDESIALDELVAVRAARSLGVVPNALDLHVRGGRAVRLVVPDRAGWLETLQKKVVSRSEEITDAPVAISSRAKLLSTFGVVAAAILALLVNVFASRHYRRWDATRARLYTLTDATDATLDSLESNGQDVELFVFLGGGDPLLGTIKNVLQNYQARAPRHLVVRYLDPDRDKVEFARAQAELEVNAQVEGGRILSDAQIVARHGTRVWYVKTDDMIVLDPGDDAKVQPKVEGAITSAIRAVLSTDRPRVCFTKGHGEAAIDDPEKEGLSTLKNTLLKDNFDPVAIDARKPDASYAGCVMIAIVAPHDPFHASEAKPIAEAVEKGAALLLVPSPELDLETKGLRPHGLDDVAALAGVVLDDAIAVEEDPALREPEGLGLVLRARVHPHVTTDPLRKFADERGAEAVVPLVYARPMRRVDTQGVSASELLVTSDSSFALHDVAGFVTSKSEPQKAKDDRAGPLDLAVAATRDPQHGGARMIVVGSATPFINAAYLDPSPLMTLSRELGLLWIAWLTARPPILDIPPKPAVQIAMHLTEDDLSSISRYVLGYMPGAIGLIGVAVWLRRRSTEGRRAR